MVNSVWHFEAEEQDVSLSSGATVKGQESLLCLH